MRRFSPVPVVSSRQMDILAQTDAIAGSPLAFAPATLGREA